MKKASINYNNIILKKKSSDPNIITKPANTTLKNNDKNSKNNSPSNEHNFEKILKQKHIIFKSKVQASKSPPAKQCTPSKLALRKRSFSDHTDPDISTQLNSLKKRYKLKAIEAFENSFDDDNGNVFDMPETKSTDPSKPVVKKETLPPTTEPTKKIFLVKHDSDDDKNVYSKENIESTSKIITKKLTSSPVKSKQASPQKIENPYKKVYPEKKIRLNINNTSLTDDDECKSFDLLKITRTRGSLDRLSLQKSSLSPETEKLPISPKAEAIKKSPKAETAKKSPKADKVKKSPKEDIVKKSPKTETEKKNAKKKTFSINIKSADLSDEDFDEVSTKKLIFKKSASAEVKPIATNPKSNQIFSAEFYEELEKDDLDLEKCSKLIIKKKSTTILTESKSEVTSPKQAFTDSPDTKNKPKKLIFSSKRHNEETTVKASICFNLNPNIEDTNFKVTTKESLNDAVCLDSNSSCSNSPKSTNGANSIIGSSNKTSLRINFVDSSQKVYG